MVFLARTTATTNAILLNMAARNFLRRCFSFYNGIPIESLRILNQSAMHLGKMLLASIFGVISVFEEATKTFRRQRDKRLKGGKENFDPKWPLERVSDMITFFNTKGT